MILCAYVFLGLFIFLALDADHWRKNADAALSLFDSAFKLVPRIQASNAGCVRLLPRNLKDVAERVIVKSAHRREIGGKSFAVSLLQLLNQGLHVGRDYFFRGLLLLRLVGVLGGRGDSVCGGDSCAAHR